MVFTPKQAPGCQVTNIHTYTCVHTPLCRNLLNQTIFHIQVGIKGLVVIHNLPPFDEKAVALTRDKREGADRDFLDH